MSAEHFLHFEKSEPYLHEVPPLPEPPSIGEILKTAGSVALEIAKVVFQGMDYTSHEDSNRKS